MDPIKDVTSDHDGLFFHVESEGSAAFNQTWEESSPRITGVKKAEPVEKNNQITFSPGTWSKKLYDGASNGRMYYYSFCVSDVEVRPQLCASGKELTRIK